MEIEWVTLADFPNYLISNHGDIVNKSTGRWLHQSHATGGVVKVGLVRAGKQHTRSVKVLVAEHFVEGRDEVFDTPIHLDGDRDNNRADNLVWRPRWFAWEYARQFSNITDNDRIGPLRDVETRETYFDIVECAVLNGLLFKDIRKSMALKESVFPTFQTFEFI